MHCPNCGARASADQKFCRSCGLSLGELSTLLAERLPEAKAELESSKLKLDKVAVVLVTGAVAILVGAIFWGVITEIIIGKGQVFGGILFLAVITSFLLGGLILSYSTSLGKRLARHQSGSDAGKVNTTPELITGKEGALIVSVTERTTELIDEENYGKKEREQSRKNEA